MKPKLKNLKLKDIIDLADKAYHDHLVMSYFKHPFVLGISLPSEDALAEFIVKELKDTFDKSVPEAEQLSQASRAMENASAELTAVANALRNKLFEPTKQLEADRRSAADKAWESAEIPSVESFEGWNIDNNFWSRKVFWTMDSGPWQIGSFGVTFEHGTSKIIDRWHQ